MSKIEKTKKLSPKISKVWALPFSFFSVFLEKFLHYIETTMLVGFKLELNKYIF